MVVVEQLKENVIYANPKVGGLVLVFRIFTSARVQIGLYFVFGVGIEQPLVNKSPSNVGLSGPICSQHNC